MIRSDLMRETNEYRYIATTVWSPIIFGTDLSFCSCLKCGATIMSWYDSEGCVDWTALDIHSEWHEEPPYEGE